MTKGFRTYWERREEYDFEDYFKINEENNIEEDLKRFIYTEIDPTIDPAIQIRIFRNKNDTMVIKSDHSIMDGGGFYDFLSLLNITYTNLLKNPNLKLTLNTNTNRSLTQVLKHYTIIRKIKSFAKESSFTPTWPFPAIGNGKRSKNFIHKTFNQERFFIIKNYGKEFNATINDMILTAFYRVLFVLTTPNSEKKNDCLCSY